MVSKEAAVLSLLVLAGCWLGEAAIQDKIDGIDDTGADGPGAVVIEAVEPPWGTDAGGTEVTLSASPVGEGVVVRFDGAVATVLDVRGDEVVVRTPSHAPGPVDVSVQWGEKSGNLDEAFTYYPDGTGRYGAIGVVGFYDVVGPYAFLYEDGGYAWVNLVAPGPYAFSDFYGSALDTCESGRQFPEAIVEASDLQSLGLIRVGGEGLTLAWDDDEDAFVSELGPPGAFGNAYAYQATYNLATLNGSSKYPPISVPGLVRTPGLLTNVLVGCTGCGAATTLDTTLFPPQANKAGFELRWNAAGAADHVLVRLDLWDNDGSLMEQIRCLVADDGAFTIPDATWVSSFGGSRDLDVWIGRERTSEAVFPHDGSLSGVSGVSWVFGYVTLYDP